MERTTDNSFLLRRSRWMIRLRWIAAISVVLGTYISHDLFGIAIPAARLYVLAGLLIIYNLLISLLLNRYSRRGESIISKILTRSIDFQISFDMLFLVFLLHYTGGIESPFIFFFILHMIIACFFLTVWRSYLKATFAVLLFGVMILLEYSGFVPHYCLEGYIVHCSYRDTTYVLGFTLVITVTLYLVVFITTKLSPKIKQAENSHRPMNAKQTEQDRFIDEYVVGLAHDVKGHLAAIQSCLDIVLKGALDKQSLEFASRAYNRTKKLISHMKIFMRLTNTRFNSNIQISRLSLKQIVHNVVNTLRPEAEEKSITLNCYVSGNGQDIYGIESSVEEILITILMNTIMLTPKNSEITVGIAGRADSLQLQISDTGIDISETDWSKLYNKFYWANKEESAGVGGVALELLSIKHIVEDHGGEIKVNGKDGQGTHFIITLPCFSEIVKTQEDLKE